MTPEDPHAVLGVDKNATEADIKKAFRARAKALHPDTSSPDVAEDAFHVLKAAYEHLLDARGGTKDAMDDTLGPGMRARLDAARKWRERSESKASGGVAPAREWTEMRAASSTTGESSASRAVKASGSAFDEEAATTLDDLLQARRAARASASKQFMGSTQASKLVAPERRSRTILFLCVAFCGSVVFAHKLTRKMDAKEKH